MNLCTMAFSKVFSHLSVFVHLMPELIAQSYSFCCSCDYFSMRFKLVGHVLQLYSVVSVFPSIEYYRYTDMCEKKQNFWLVIDFHSFCHSTVGLALKIVSLFGFFFDLYRWLLVFLFHVYDVRKKREKKAQAHFSKRMINGYGWMENHIRFR